MMWEHVFSKIKQLIIEKNTQPSDMDLYLPESNLFTKDKSDIEKLQVSTNLLTNKLNMEIMFNIPVNKEVVIRKITNNKNIETLIMYIDGMVNSNMVNVSIVKPLIENQDSDPDKIGNSIQTNSLKQESSIDNIVSSVLAGDLVVFIDKSDKAYICDVKGFEHRGVETPQTEGAVRGSQESFNELIKTNITLIRRIVKSPKLVSEYLALGDLNKTKCALVYIDGIVNPKIVAEAKRRLENVKSDFIQGSGMVEQFIEDSPFSIFPNMISTERPDRTAFHICQGRVAIIVDGSPFALIMPITMSSLLHTLEDLEIRWPYGLMLRTTRIMAFIFSCVAAGLYVAIANFHHSVIPLSLLVAIAKSVENVMIPMVLQVLIMEISFELIQEAGTRVPGIMGNTVGIVGTLVIGQAAVNASLISPIVIIIIAATGICSFTMPDFGIAMAIRIIRLIFIFAGGFLGFLGIGLAIVILTTWISNTNSLGIPMMTPLTPEYSGTSDYLSRKLLWKQEKRSNYLNPLQTDQQPKISRIWNQRKKK